MNSSTTDRVANHIPDVLVGMAVILVLVTGAIHLIDAPDNFSEAAYKGVMFGLNGLAAIVAAFGIYRGSRLWGWGLGTLVTGGAVVMYVVSRTIGLPGLGVDDDWLEPMGVLSVVVESAFVILAALVATQFGWNNSQRTQLTAAH